MKRKKSKSNLWKRAAAFWTAVLLCISVFTQTAFAVPWPDNCYVVSDGACVMDADSGIVLFGKNEHTSYFPASITKVMTALVVLENCNDLNEMVTFSYDAVAIEEDNATIIGASEGDQLTVRDCLYSLLFQSANEVANALAEHVGAKHPELRENNETNRQIFVKLMNERAKELGCQNTHFNNPSGLTDENHYTSAYDMCLIMAEAVKNETFVDIERHTYWTHAPIKRYPDPKDPWNTVYPKHLMLKRNSYQYYPGVFAGKTGYTMTAGNTLVTACKKDGMTLVTTVLNGHNNHYNDTRRLLDFGYANFQSVQIADHDSTHSAVEEDLSVQSLPLVDSVTLGIDEKSRVSLPRDAEFSDVTKALSLEELPENALGALVYQYEGRTVGRAYLKTMQLGGTELLDAAKEDPLLKASEKTEAPALLEGETEEGNPETASAEAEGESGASSDAGENAPVSDVSNAAEETTTSAEEAKEENFLGIPKAAFAVLQIVVVLLVAGLIAALFMLRAEKREAIARAKRRQQRLRHTRDMTGQQNIKMDMLVQQRLRKRKRKRKR